MASQTSGQPTTGNGKSIFKLTIKNRPYISAYQVTSKEPYLSLASEIQYSVSFKQYDAQVVIMNVEMNLMNQYLILCLLSD